MLPAIKKSSCRLAARWHIAAFRYKPRIVQRGAPSRVFAIALVRTTPRQQQGEGHDGAHARAQHSAIWLGQKPIAPQSAASAADFSAGSRRGSDIFRCAQSSARILCRPTTGKAIVADKVAPGLLDRYLAHSGYDSQQYNGAEDPNRPHNLWQAVPGDHRAHGAFDAHAVAGVRNCGRASTVVGSRRV